MFKFRKVASILASSVMLTSTVALAAAANYPAPFVAGGNADVAIVHGGADAQYTDLIAVTDITASLQAALAAQTATPTTTSGPVDCSAGSADCTPLFSGGTKIYINDSISVVKKVLTKTELPTVLKDESWSGSNDATMVQTIDIGSNPYISFEKQPTSSDDPDFGVKLNTATAKYFYNASIIFGKEVNFTHVDSLGETLTMFGQEFTVSSATDLTSLVLLKEAERVSLSTGNPSAEVTISGNTYTIDLVSASDDAATIKVTDSSGNSQVKEINQDASRKVQGITIAVTSADETNFDLSATIIAGAEKVTLKNGNSVKIGEEDKTVKGTKVTFSGGNEKPNGLTKITISVSASNSNNDALKSGEVFVDPVFGSFKFDFAGLNIERDSTTRRELIDIVNNGDDKMDVTFTEWRGNSATVTYISNRTAMGLKIDDDGHNITILEEQVIKFEELVVVGNEDEGYLIQLTEVTNDIENASISDDVLFTDVFSGDSYDTTWTTDGVGTVSIGGKSYDVELSGNSDNDTEEYKVRLNYPDSSGANAAVIFPSIQTGMGAKIAFYQPTTINVVTFDGTNTLNTLRIPDGDGYTDLTFSGHGIPDGSGFNVTDGTTAQMLDSTNAGLANVTSITYTIGQFKYNVTASAANTTTIYVLKPSGGNENNPGLLIHEERDDNSEYQGMLVITEEGSTSDSGIGISDIERTWESDNTAWEHTLSSDSKIQLDTDLWGSLITTDSSDTDQKFSSISYPDEQVYVMLYVAEESANIVGSGGSGGGNVQEIGSVTVTDNEVGSVSGKNWIVVGGSCINSAAADLLGVSSPTCTGDFTSATNVGSGQFLIETFARSGDKVATLVAGYNAIDTTNAGKYFTTEKPDTSVGMKYIGTSASSAQLVV